MAAIIVGSGLGILLGSRLPDRTRELTTQALGLVVLVVAALNVAALLDADWIGDVGSTAPILICLAAIVIGGVIGSLLRIEARLEGMGGWHRSFSQFSQNRWHCSLTVEYGSLMHPNDCTDRS